MAPRRTVDRAPAAALGAGAAEVRCCCGSLLARWTPDGIELKCRRCKRHVVVPIEGIPDSAGETPSRAPPN